MGGFLALVMSQIARSALTAVTALCLVAAPTFAQCDRFVTMVGESVDQYRDTHRVPPANRELHALSVRFMPRFWIDPTSSKPVDFADYLARATLRSQETGDVIATPPVAGKLAELSRDEQCASYLEAPDLNAADSASDSALNVDPVPVYVQGFKDEGPDGSENWLYLKYTYVFDWSGLAKDRGLLTRIGSALTGGEADRWHRLDVHTSAILGLDAERRLRTVTLQQHNNKRTYVAGIDFDARDGVHIAAARRTNELYLDTGAGDTQYRRAVPSFLQWPFLISEDAGTLLWQVDEFIGRHAGAQEIRTRAVFSALDAPLATFAGLLAPKRRILGLYVGRDGPPGYDYTGTPEMPHAVAVGYWREGDEIFLEVLDEHLKGFQTTNWTEIRGYLASRLRIALGSTSKLASEEGAAPNRVRP